MLIPDLGAEAIKVERETSGDAMHAWPPLTDGFSDNFASARLRLIGDIYEYAHPP
jgi:crotonobetainyl-CoA:carnitine CoA-transferase CaiB-like acyl-CoA transferase